MIFALIFTYFVINYGISVINYGISVIKLMYLHKSSSFIGNG